MEMINIKSLYRTIDNLNQHYLEGRKLTSAEKKEIAKWISGRQGLKGSYANMFAPTAIDFKGIRSITGEKLTSKASIAHILGEESLRALYLLDPKDRKSSSAIEKARSGINEVLKSNYEMGNFAMGTYCCGKCTVSYWRNISAEGGAKNKTILNAGIKYLKSVRDGKGKWKVFPFFYTVLALTGIDLPSAREELKYAAKACDSYLKRKGKGDVYEKRKKEIAKRALEKI